MVLLVELAVVWLGSPPASTAVDAAAPVHTQSPRCRPVPQRRASRPVAYVCVTRAGRSIYNTAQRFRVLLPARACMLMRWSAKSPSAGAAGDADARYETVRLRPCLPLIQRALHAIKPIELTSPTGPSRCIHKQAGWKAAPVLRCSVRAKVSSTSHTHTSSSPTSRMSTPSPPPPSAAPIAAAMPPSEAAPAPPAPLTAATAATAAASPAAVADEPQEGECEASARLAAYMDAPLPYTPEDWQRVNCDGCRHNKRCALHWSLDRDS